MLKNVKIYIYIITSANTHSNISVADKNITQILITFLSHFFSFLSFPLHTENLELTDLEWQEKQSLGAKSHATVIMSKIHIYNAMSTQDTQPADPLEVSCPKLTFYIKTEMWLFHKIFNFKLCAFWFQLFEIFNK